VEQDQQNQPTNNEMDPVIATQLETQSIVDLGKELIDMMIIQDGSDDNEDP
jgi:flagellar hook protein FlgE